ncbi:phosphodiester glycosidase family protein [Actinosynnema pretiosum]|uniref:Multidrug transporter n=1 Tax=Actinosynnema pretiosum TaxID=42197 RepID=A0A290Z4Z9_9PSEU|nr:phosphodiester glycosidase family protein [Actinosynnema pretiosum]ATE54064.1 multidrug transporter [Actinosynnema pretiosum]
MLIRTLALALVLTTTPVQASPVGGHQAHPAHAGEASSRSARSQPHPDLSDLPDVPDLPDLATAASREHLETDRAARPVAPGVELTSFDWYRADGWVRGDALTVDLAGGTKVDYLDPGSVTAAAPLSEQADRTRAVAAVNGDFFDINNSGAPEGAAVRDGLPVKSASPGRERAVGVDAAGVGRVMEVLFSGTAALPGGDLALNRLNSAELERDGVALFTPLWGDYTRSRTVRDAQRVREVVVRHDVVTEVRDAVGADRVPEDGYVLLGREAGATALAVAPGDHLSVRYATRAGDGGSAPRAAIGGDQVLLRDGEVVAPDDASHPRTAVGFSADGKRMFLLTVDGRQSAHLLGLNLKDVAEALRDLGAHNALNLDGGGSSTLVAREPGGDAVHLENTPSDGGQRPVPNGLALYAPRGSGRLTGFWVTTATDPRTAPTAGAVPGGRPDRVFPGLTRKMVAQGYDETYGPVADERPVWTSTNPLVGRASGNGVFRAAAAGTTRVIARQSRIEGSQDLTVLGALERLSATSGRVSLPDVGAGARVGIVGYDHSGFSAPVEPSDLALSYDHSVLEVGEDEGALLVTARAPGSTTIEVTVQGRTTRVPVTVGTEERLLAGFDDAARWTFGSARGSGSVSPTPDGHTGQGLALRYDFTQSTGTRTAYANPPQALEVPGKPLALSAWVRAAGRGEWTAFTVVDAQGLTRSLYGPHLTWDGWQRLEVPVPGELAFPIKVTRFYTIETAADRQYAGEVVVDDITAVVPPDAEPPPREVVRDDVVVRDGTVDGSPWRFAVMSDAQFVARAPDSELVRAARRTLREVRAERPDFVVINGDLVDEAAPEDLALARRVLTEELGDAVPWFYVPGNHEVMGPGTIDNFRREFGATTRVLDHRRTRFVLLDTSLGTLRAGGYAQVAALRRALDEHGAVDSVVVLEHHPTRDPGPLRTSELSDRMEAALVERWLADFRSSTGKPAAFVGAHAGLFAASRVDGVPYLVNGNSGKAPSGDTGTGGFTGWSLIGVEPGGIRAEVRAHVDALRLTAPRAIPVGGTGAVSAEVEQAGRRVPVTYPMSADWSGSTGLHVGGPDGVRPWHVARLDPDTGTLTGLRPGRVSVVVAVSEAVTRVDVAVTAGER